MQVNIRSKLSRLAGLMALALPYWVFADVTVRETTPPVKLGGSIQPLYINSDSNWVPESEQDETIIRRARLRLSSEVAEGIAVFIRRYC